jgi:hypothetical protein
LSATEEALTQINGLNLRAVQTASIKTIAYEKVVNDFISDMVSLAFAIGH